MAEHGITDEEVARGKGQLRGGLVLGLEDTGSRMSRIGKGELVYGEVLSVDEVLARIDAVTPDECARWPRTCCAGRSAWPWSGRSRSRTSPPSADRAAATRLGCRHDPSRADGVGRDSSAA